MKEKIELECPYCGHKQIEEETVGDKFAWQCKGCEVIIEDGKAHLLTKTARFIAKKGGNVCTGFGGLYGEVSVNKNPGTKPYYKVLSEGPLFRSVQKYWEKIVKKGQ